MDSEQWQSSEGSDDCKELNSQVTVVWNETENESEQIHL